MDRASYESLRTALECPRPRVIADWPAFVHPHTPPEDPDWPTPRLMRGANAILARLPWLASEYASWEGTRRVHYSFQRGAWGVAETYRERAPSTDLSDFPEQLDRWRGFLDDELPYADSGPYFQRGPWGQRGRELFRTMVVAWIPRFHETFLPPWWARCRCLFAGGLPTHSERQFQGVLEVARTGEDWQRVGAVKTLGRIGDPRALSTVLDALSDPLDSLLNDAAVQAVRTLGTEAEAAVPRLLSMLLSPSPLSTVSAVDVLAALCALGGTVELALPEVVGVVKTWEYTERGQAVRPLASLGEIVISHMLELLGSRRFHLREFAAVVLGHVGAVAAPVLPDLQRLAASDSSTAVQRACREAIAAIQGEGLPPDPERWISYALRGIGEFHWHASENTLGGEE